MCFSEIGTQTKVPRSMHASGTTLNKPAQNLKKKYHKTLFIQKNRSVFWPGNFLEGYLSQYPEYRIDCASEDCLSQREVKF